MEKTAYACYDTADYLQGEEDIAACIEPMMEEGVNEPAYVAQTLEIVARALYMAALAAKSRGAASAWKGRCREMGILHSPPS